MKENQAGSGVIEISLRTEARLQKLKQAGSESWTAMGLAGGIAYGFRPRQSGRVGRIKACRASRGIAFLVVFLSTFPVALPFLLIGDVGSYL